MNEWQNKFNDETIKEAKDVLDCISDNIFSSPNVGISYRGLFMQGHEPFTSVARSLESLDYCVSRNHYSDAYSMLRKIRDDLFQGLVLYMNLRKANTFDKRLTEEEIQEIIKTDKGSRKERNELLKTKKENVATYASEAWTHNDIKDGVNKRIISSFFDYTEYITYLTTSNNKLKELNEKYFKDILERLNSKLNNYVHGNGSLYQTNNYFSKEPQKMKKEFLSDFINIISIVVAFMAIIDSIVLRSMDAMDAVENGCKPTQEELSCVAPVIQNFMTSHLDKQILMYIQNNQKYEMNIYNKESI